MTRTRLIRFAALVLALFAGSAVAAALPHEDGGAKRAIVVAAQDQDTIVRAKAAAQRSGADLRVVRAYADQLGVTRMLAARGYRTVVTIGVDPAIAITPVHRRYPGTRFVVDPRDVAQALR